MGLLSLPSLVLCGQPLCDRQQALQDEMEGTLEARYGMDPSQFSGGVKVAPPELTEI